MCKDRGLFFREERRSVLRGRALKSDRDRRGSGKEREEGGKGTGTTAAQVVLRD